MMKKILLVFFIFFALSCFSKIVSIDSYERLDPHGGKYKPVLLPAGKECTVCHTFTDGKAALRGAPEKTCALCHNKSPHSGIREHLEKTHENKPMTCLSCHTSHRWEAKDWESPGNFWSPQKKEKIVPPKGSEEVWNDLHKKNSLIQKSCSECHKW